MKAILFTDIHLGLSKDSEEFHKIALDFADWMAETARKRDIDTLICCGDVFHNRKSIALATIDVAFKFFDKLKEFKIKIITGNHDCLYLENSDVHSISLLKRWENITVYDELSYENIDGRKLAFVPWGVMPKDIEKSDMIFGHFEINGFQMQGKFCEKGLTATSLLNRAPLVFSGHFHKPQTNVFKAGQVMYLGSPYQHNWGEAGESKFIYELDFKTLGIEKIENTISPKHIQIESIDDIHKADGNIVRIYCEDKDSDLYKEAEKVVAVNLETIVEDKEIVKATETIKDFKGVDVVSGFEEVVEVLEGPSPDMKEKILLKVTDYYQKVPQ